MKKLLCLILALLMVFALVACSNGGDDGSNTSPSAGTLPSADGGDETPDSNVKAPADTKVVFAMKTMDGDYWLEQETELRARFTAGGYQFESVSAEMDTLTQIEQVENAAAGGADIIIIIPVDGEAMKDVCQRIMDQGVLVYAFVQDTYNRNTFMTLDETVAGAAISQLASQWIDENYPDAGESEFNAVILGLDNAEKDALRLNAMIEAAEADPRINVLESYAIKDGSSVTIAQEAAENMIVKYNGDIDLFIVSGASIGIGVNAVVMSESSPYRDLDDLSRLGIFSCDISEEVAAALKDSQNGESIWRATVSVGGTTADVMDQIYNQSVLMLNGEDYEELLPLNTYSVTPDNLADYGY